MSREGDTVLATPLSYLRSVGSLEAVCAMLVVSVSVAGEGLGLENYFGQIRDYLLAVLGKVGLVEIVRPGYLSSRKA